MGDSVLMTIIYRLEYLQKYFGSLFFWEEFGLVDAIEQFAAFAELGHKVKILFVFEELVEFEDVRMVQLLQDSDFHLKLLQVRNFLLRH